MVSLIYINIDLDHGSNLNIVQINLLSQYWLRVTWQYPKPVNVQLFNIYIHSLKRSQFCIFQTCGIRITCTQRLYEPNITLKKAFWCCGNKTLKYWFYRVSAALLQRYKWQRYNNHSCSISHPMDAAGSWSAALNAASPIRRAAFWKLWTSY